MRLNAFFGLILMATLVCALDSPAHARPVQNWTEKDLADRADLVVIATATSSQDEPADRSNAKADSWVGVNTKFKASAVLKGKLKDDDFILLHQRFFGGDEAEIAIIDGPDFVKFDAKGGTKYLLFLKKLDDGRFEAVSGQYDPHFSVKIMQEYANRVVGAAEANQEIKPAERHDK